MISTVWFQALSYPEEELRWNHKFPERHTGLRDYLYMKYKRLLLDATCFISGSKQVLIRPFNFFIIANFFIKILFLSSCESLLYY